MFACERFSYIKKNKFSLYPQKYKDILIIINKLIYHIYFMLIIHSLRFKNIQFLLLYYLNINHNVNIRHGYIILLILTKRVGVRLEKIIFSNSFSHINF